MLRPVQFAVLGLYPKISHSLRSQFHIICLSFKIDLFQVENGSREIFMVYSEVFKCRSLYKNIGYPQVFVLME